jgi:anti-sigma factor RsiW
MPNCLSIDPLVTAYVDGVIAASDRSLVDQHVRVCATCRSRIAAELAVRGLLVERRAALCEQGAPDALKTRCAQLASRQPAVARYESQSSVFSPTAISKPPSLQPPASSLQSWRSRLGPLAMAATLVLIVGAAFLYQLTSASSHVMAAELTADHVKCFAMNSILRTHQSTSVVQSSLMSGFGWEAQLPEDTEGLELVGERPCLYGEGKVAHIMYRYNGRPVSLFMLPKSERATEVIGVLGHEASIWSVGDRTFVLIARETEEELERLTAFIQASLR